VCVCVCVCVLCGVWLFVCVCVRVFVCVVCVCASACAPKSAQSLQSTSKLPHRQTNRQTQAPTHINMLVGGGRALVCVWGERRTAMRMPGTIAAFNHTPHARHSRHVFWRCFAKNILLAKNNSTGQPQRNRGGRRHTGTLTT
jgi:hypothetical protein